MASTVATSVAQYLQGLPPDRRQVVSAVRDVIRRALPAGYSESLGWGMICYGIPLSTYPDTYNGQPLTCAALAAQKNHFALYLMCAYMDPALEATLKNGFAAAGKRLDMGKSCLRFKRLDDLALDTVGEIIASAPPERLIAQYEASRQRAPRGRSASGAGARQAARKSGAGKRAGKGVGGSRKSR